MMTITNKLVLEDTPSSRVNEVLTFLRGENGIVDFNNIRDMPKELAIEASSVGEIGEAYLLGDIPMAWDTWSPEVQDKALFLGQQYLTNKQRWGHPNWYDWCVANWGTSWNAIDSKFISPNEIWFYTINNGIPSLMSELSKNFPDIHFSYQWADDTIGYNCGVSTFYAGEGQIVSSPIKSPAAYQIYHELHQRQEMQEIKIVRLLRQLPFHITAASKESLKEFLNNNSKSCKIKI